MLKARLGFYFFRIALLYFPEGLPLEKSELDTAREAGQDDEYGNYLATCYAMYPGVQFSSTPRLFFLTIVNIHCYKQKLLNLYFQKTGDSENLFSSYVCY